jgi:hypothetical protein
VLRYHSLPSLERLPHKRRRTPHIQLVPLLLVGPLLLFVFFVAWDVSSYGNCYFRPLCRALGNGSETTKEIWWRNSGPYAPWKSLGPGGGRSGLPRGCEIDQVNVASPDTGRYSLTRLIGIAASTYCPLSYYGWRRKATEVTSQAAGQGHSSSSPASRTRLSRLG